MPRNRALHWNPSAPRLPIARFRREGSPIRRILFATAHPYLDDTNGAAVASRAMMESLGRSGFAVEALSGTGPDATEQANPSAWLSARGIAFEEVTGVAWSVGVSGILEDRPPHFRLDFGGVPITLCRSTGAQPHLPDQMAHREFLRLFDEVLNRFRPDVLVNYGGGPLAHQIRARARARGIAVVFALHNLSYANARPFTTVDAVIVPSRFAASHYSRTLGLECRVLSNIIDLGRVRAETPTPRYVTFVTPSHEKGVYAFARIADELGRRRPDIPILVVEGRGAEQTLVDCGIDLRARGNVSLMANTPDPRHFWGVTKVCLMPSLCRESQPLVAIEAMANGIPVVGSDRGGIPEVLGKAGIVLSLPERLTPTTRILPAPEEVSPWVEAVIKLWDDEAHYAEHRRIALAESLRWAPEAIEPLYSEFFNTVNAGGSPFIAHSAARGSGGSEDRAAGTVVSKRPRTEPLLECCIVFTHYRDDDTTRYHLELLRRLNPFPVVAVCNASSERVEGAIDVDLLSKRWSSEDKWGSADSILYRWFLHGGVRAQRYLMLEWDTLATAPVKEFFGDLWDRDVVGTSVKLHEAHAEWQWFREQMHLLPPALRQHAAGIVPFNGLLLSHRALSAVVDAEPPPGIFCELRIGTLLRSAGFELAEYPPEKQRMNSFHPLNISFDGVTPGIYHPIKRSGAAPPASR
jgi:glycosyltransferase involved in cell wall biosynthesis